MGVQLKIDIMEIPKIIHQIWSEKYKPMPDFFRKLAQTWISHHPNWEYKLWGEEDMESFVRMEYPQYYELYSLLPFDMQRWDIARFMILDKMGGMHVDCDYECMENIEPLLANNTCCIALEPDTHRKAYNVSYCLNSALLASIPGHPFLNRVITKVFSNETFNYDRSSKPMCILNTTGPLMLSHLYVSLSEEDVANIYLMPAKFVTPFDSRQIELLKKGIENDELENCLEEAYAVHYFSNAWLPIL